MGPVPVKCPPLGLIWHLTDRGYHVSAWVGPESSDPRSMVVYTRKEHHEDNRWGSSSSGTELAQASRPGLGEGCLMDSRGRLLSEAMLLKTSTGNQGTRTLGISWEVVVEILAHSQPYPGPAEAEPVLGRIPRGRGHGLASV